MVPVSSRSGSNTEPDRTRKNQIATTRTNTHHQNAPATTQRHKPDTRESRPQDPHGTRKARHQNIKRHQANKARTQNKAPAK